MEIYSSYQVRIKGSPNITTCIADSDPLLASFLSKLKGLILEYEHSVSNQHGSTKKPLVVGLDVECNSMNLFKAAILQLCFGTQCVIIQLLHMGINYIPVYLNDFLADQDIVYVGVDIKTKLANLECYYKLQCSKNVIELGSLADRVRRTSKLFDYKLEDLAREIVGIEIKKPDSFNLAKWGSRELTSEQIEYATIIAYASSCIGNTLLAEGGNN